MFPSVKAINYTGDRNQWLPCVTLGNVFCTFIYVVIKCRLLILLITLIFFEYQPCLPSTPAHFIVTILKEKRKTFIYNLLNNELTWDNDSKNNRQHIYNRVKHQPDQFCHIFVGPVWKKYF